MSFLGILGVVWPLSRVRFMSSEFNPYSSWLGIPEDEQPPHYYRLLGLEPFESDLDAIRQAGQKVLGVVTARDKGASGPAARRLKAEIKFAATCLLDPRKKAQYDRELDAWFNDNDLDSESSAGGDDYELEEPDLPLAKIVQKIPAKKTTTSTKSSSGKAKAGSKSKSDSSKTKQTAEKPAVAKTPMNKNMIAGIAAMVLAVVGLGGGLAFVFMREAPAKVAKTEAKPTVSKPAGEEEETTPKKKPLSEEEEEEEASKKKPAGEEEEETGAKKLAGKEEEKTPDKTGEKNPAGTAAAGEKPPGEKPAGEGDPALPGTGKEPAAGEKPVEVAKVDPMAKEPAKVDEKKDPAKPAEPPKEEPKDPKLEDPFRELPESVELPVFVDKSSTTPVVLTKLYPKEGEQVNVKMLGGEAVLAKQGEFKISGGALTDPEPKWSIKFVPKSGPATSVAEMAYKANEISFAWTGQGDPAINNVLRNCVLRVSAGYSTRPLQLRKSIEIEPLQVVMETKGTSTSFELVGLPEDRTQVILQITKLIGGFPEKADYDPSAELNPGGSTQITFQKLDLAFKATLEEEKGNILKFDFRPMLRKNTKLRNGTRPMIPYPAKVDLDGEIQREQQAQAAGLAYYTQAKPKVPMAQAEVFELQYQEALKQSNDKIKGLTDAKTMLAQLTAGGKVQFRIFMRLGETSVELLRTKDLSPPEPEKKAAAAPDPKAKKKR